MARVGIGSIRLMGPDLKEGEDTTEFDARNQEANNLFWANMNEAEQVLNEWVPEGYYVKVDHGIGN